MSIIRLNTFLRVEFEIDRSKETQKFKGHNNDVSSVAFSPDGKFIISGSLDKTIRVWNLINGKEIMKLEGH